MNTASAEAVPAPARAVGRLDRIEYRLFRIAFGFFAALPRRRAIRLGARLGELFYLADRRDRRIALFNLRIAFPDKTVAERARILRASCRNLGRMAAEFCHLPRLEPDQLPAIVAFANRQVWEEVIERAGQSGAVVLTAHFGNWELLAYVHGLLGHPITVVHRAMRNRIFDEAITAVRSRAGTRAIKKRAAAKEILRTLHQHGIVAIPADQNQIFSYGVFVDFFGLPACTTPGPARLAMLTGAPIWPVFLVREGESERHRIEVLPELKLVTTGDRAADVLANTQRCTAVIEDMIRRHPEQWIWFHKRWKTRPPGEPKLYT